MTDAPKTIYERVLAIATEVGKIQATGQNQQQRRAVSIYDVENAIRDILAKEGILTRWSRVDMERYEEPTKAGSMTMFVLTLRVRFVNALDKEDFFEDEWTDIGNSPAGAASFVRKGYYKALFHLAEESDDKLPDYGSRGSENDDRPGIDRPWREGDKCGECAKVGRNRKFKPAAGGPHKGQLQCSYQDENEQWQHHEPPPFEEPPVVLTLEETITAGDCRHCRELGFATKSGKVVRFTPNPEGLMVCTGYDAVKEVNVFHEKEPEETEPTPSERALAMAAEKDPNVVTHDEMSVW